MFIRYLEPIFKPWRAMRNKIQKVRTTRGRFKADVNRVKRFGGVAKNYQKQAAGHVKGAQSQAQKAQGQMGKAQAQMGQAQGQMGQVQGQMQGQMGGMQQPMPGQMPPPGMQGGQMQGQMPGGQMPGGPMAQPGAINPNPPIKKVGFFRRRKICTQCNAELDKTWDSCPYCAQAAAAAQAQGGPAKPASPKTQAFQLNAVGASVQLMGWLVPIQGPQRGELFTLAPHSVIGTDPTCQVVLADNYMSSQHAEIKAENGIWLLKDLGSTNGTMVNDKRVDTHELVDNDFIKFGNSLIKFKSL